MLVHQGESITWIAAQAGHSSPTVTLDTYSHLFAKEEHAERMRGRMEESYGSILSGAIASISS